jgi:hypothetical protein
VDFYLCGLKPNEEEKVWGLAVTKLVKSWIEDVKNPRQDECFLSGKVKFQSKIKTLLTFCLTFIHHNLDCTDCGREHLADVSGVLSADG